MQTLQQPYVCVQIMPKPKGRRIVLAGCTCQALHLLSLQLRSPLKSLMLCSLAVTLPLLDASQLLPPASFRLLPGSRQHPVTKQWCTVLCKLGFPCADRPSHQQDLFGQGVLLLDRWQAASSRGPAALMPTIPWLEGVEQAYIYTENWLTFMAKFQPGARNHESRELVPW